MIARFDEKEKTKSMIMKDIIDIGVNSEQNQYIVCLKGGEVRELPFDTYSLKFVFEVI